MLLVLSHFISHIDLDHQLFVTHSATFSIYLSPFQILSNTDYTTHMSDSYNQSGVCHQLKQIFSPILSTVNFRSAHNIYDCNTMLQIKRQGTDDCVFCPCSPFHLMPVTAMQTVISFPFCSRFLFRVARYIFWWRLQC